MRRVLASVALTGLTVLLSASCLAGPLVSRVSIANRSDGRGFVVRLHTDGVVKAFSLPKKLANREFEIVLFDANVSSSYIRPRDATPLSSFNLVRRDTRLSFRFELDGDYEISVYRDRSSTDILVGLVRAEGPVVAETPRGPSRESRERWALDTIIIDAGHGGKDPGTMGNGYKEKDIALAVAKKLGKMLEDELGVNVVYTRSDDTFIDLGVRGRIANKAGGKLFLSIHVNAAPYSKTAHGTETYFLGLRKSAQARAVADRENSVIKLEDNPGQYKEIDENRLIQLALVQSGYMHQSELLASSIQQEFEKHSRRTNRGVKQDVFQVLWEASMPAVLIELGFITNRQEAKYLASSSGQTELASGIMRAVKSYKKDYERNLELVGK